MLYTQLFNQLPDTLELQLNLSLKKKLIEGVPMFKQIEPASVLAIVRRLQPTIAIPEEVIMRQGEKGESMYFLMRGFAICYLQTPEGEEILLTTLTDGAVLGEISMIYPDMPRSATVRALTFCEMQELLAQDFDELLQCYDDIFHHVLATADKRLQRGAAAEDSEAVEGNNNGGFDIEDVSEGNDGSVRSKLQMESDSEIEEEKDSFNQHFPTGGGASEKRRSQRGSVGGRGSISGNTAGHIGATGKRRMTIQLLGNVITAANTISAAPGVDGSDSANGAADGEQKSEEEEPMSPLSATTKNKFAALAKYGGVFQRKEMKQQEHKKDVFSLVADAGLASGGGAGASIATRNRNLHK